MPKKRTFPESPLPHEQWRLNREQDLAMFLTMLERRFRENSSDPMPAFEAIKYIAAYFWAVDKSPDSVLVPWWVVQALAIGFNKYHDAATSTAPLTLGEAYQVEGRGQGKRPKIQQSLNELRDIRIAGAIAMAKADGVKIEAALQEQAQKTGLSVVHVRRIWEQKRARALSAVTNFRTSITS
jgi:hypothetical protein